MKYAAPNHAPWSAQLASEIVTAGASREGPLLPILNTLNETFGHIPDAAVPIIASILNVSRAEVHGVISFYHDFKRKPLGKHQLKLCRAEACQSCGGDALAARTQTLLGVGFGETTADGRVSLDAVYCLGLCACAPSAMLNGKPVGRVDEERLDALIAETRS